MLKVEGFSWFCYWEERGGADTNEKNILQTGINVAQKNSVSGFLPGKNLVKCSQNWGPTHSRNEGN